MKCKRCGTEGDFVWDNDYFKNTNRWRLLEVGLTSAQPHQCQEAKLNLDGRMITKKLAEILEGFLPDLGFREHWKEKELIVRTIDNLYAKTKSTSVNAHEEAEQTWQSLSDNVKFLDGKSLPKEQEEDFAPFMEMKSLLTSDDVVERMGRIPRNLKKHVFNKKTGQWKLSEDATDGEKCPKNPNQIFKRKTSQVSWANVTYPDIKKIIESMPDEQNSTFKRCTVPSPEEVYGIEQTGLIWGFHNRFFPVKFIIHVLAKLLVEETSNPVHPPETEVQWIKFQRLTDEVKLESITASKILNEMKVGNKFENIDPTIGFPSTKNRFLEKPKLREIRSLNPMVAEEKARALEETSKNRFLTQYVGRGLDRKNGVREVAGACFEMKLIQAAVAEPYGPKDDLYVTLTDLGKEFALLENPVIKGLLDYSVHHKSTHIPFIQFQKMAEEQGMDPEDADRRFIDMERIGGVTAADYVEGVDSTHFFTGVESPIKNTFSNEESDFILKNIIPEFELEKKVVEELLKSKEKLSVSKITEVFLELQKAHLVACGDFEHVQFKDEKFDAPSSPLGGSPVVRQIKYHATSKATTIIKRMHELGLVKREQHGLQVSYTVNPR